MARARGATNERADGDGPHPGGRPRDSALDDAIIRATRNRLVRDGYSRMTIGDIVADAKVTRPTLYRRWSNKFELVIDALDYGFRKQHDMYAFDLSGMDPREALTEAVRRLDPAYFNPDAMVMMGNFAGEANRTPELLKILREHAVEPRVALIENVLSQLQERGAVRDDIDKHAVGAMCFGSYFSAFYRGESREGVPESVVSVLWPAIAKGPDDTKTDATQANATQTDATQTDGAEGRASGTAEPGR